MSRITQDPLSIIHGLPTTDNLDSVKSLGELWDLGVPGVGLELYDLGVPGEGLELESTRSCSSLLT